MIVCHCQVVSDRAVAATIDDGARTLAQVCQRTGAGQNCGGCIFSLEKILCEHGRTVDPSHLEVAS
jgi:bacterioferritin-associated ferredoxin